MGAGQGEWVRGGSKDHSVSGERVNGLAVDIFLGIKSEGGGAPNRRGGGGRAG